MMEKWINRYKRTDSQLHIKAEIVYNLNKCTSRDVDNSGKPGKLPGCERNFAAVKHYFFLQNVFKCCQKIVIYLFHLFTPSNLGIACQRHARVGLRPKYPPIIARFLPVKTFSHIPA